MAVGRNGARLRNRFGERVTPIEWDGTSGPLPAEALAGVESVYVRLEGEFRPAARPASTSPAARSAFPA